MLIKVVKRKMFTHSRPPVMLYSVMRVLLFMVRPAPGPGATTTRAVRWRWPVAAEPPAGDAAHRATDQIAENRHYRTEHRAAHTATRHRQAHMYHMITGGILAARHRGGGAAFGFIAVGTGIERKRHAQQQAGNQQPARAPTHAQREADAQRL